MKLPTQLQIQRRLALQGLAKPLMAALAGLAGLAIASTAHAHLMRAQHGTLNFVKDGGFLVLSLPASAFTTADANGDGRLSMIEFQAGKKAITARVRENVRLVDADGARRIDGLMVSPAAKHGAPRAPAPQVIVMGRFVLADPAKPLRLEMGLFGKQKSERQLQVRVSRKNKSEREVLTFTPEKRAQRLFYKS